MLNMEQISMMHDSVKYSVVIFTKNMMEQYLWHMINNKCIISVCCTNQELV